MIIPRSASLSRLIWRSDRIFCPQRPDFRHFTPIGAFRRVVGRPLLPPGSLARAANLAIDSEIITENSIIEKHSILTEKGLKFGLEKSYRYRSGLRPIHRSPSTGDFHPTYHQSTKAVICYRPLWGLIQKPYIIPSQA
jgi:hypothetical protein